MNKLALQQRLDALMTKLAYSRAYTNERTQKVILAVMYAVLALTLVAYLVFDLSEWVVTYGALPGALYFVIGLQALSYRKAIEGGDLLEVYLNMMPR